MKKFVKGAIIHNHVFGRGVIHDISKYDRVLVIFDKYNRLLHSGGGDDNPEHRCFFYYSNGTCCDTICDVKSCLKIVPDFSIYDELVQILAEQRTTK